VQSRLLSPIPKPARRDAEDWASKLHKAVSACPAFAAQSDCCTAAIVIVNAPEYHTTSVAASVPVEMCLWQITICCMRPTADVTSGRTCVTSDEESVMSSQPDDLGILGGSLIAACCVPLRRMAVLHPCGKHSEALPVALLSSHIICRCVDMESCTTVDFFRAFEWHALESRRCCRGT
jgi:hypothetical protein